MSGGAVRPPAYCVLAGHSHIAALGVPICNPGSASALWELAHPSGRFRIMTGEWPRTEAYWKEVCKAAAGNIVALFWRGNQHISAYVAESDDRFDFVLSSEPDLPLDETATVVPESLLRALYLPTLRGLAHLLRLLQAAGAQAVVCGTPPPCGNDNWIVSCLVNNPRWLRSGQVKSDVPVDPGAIRLVPRTLRYKLWALLQALERETAASTGAPFLASPRVAQTVDGFLRDEYRLDITHANKAYGALVLEGLWERMQANSTPV
jgi:hypothetical protein